MPLGADNPLLAPIESITDQSVFKGLVFSATLVIGHPLFYWVWTRAYPEPYESLGWRLVCTGLGAAALLAIRKWGPNDKRAQAVYSVATAVGSVGIASWFFVANGADAVWLASLAAMTMVYFSLTDWRIAIVVTPLAYALAYWLVPAFDVGVWAYPGSEVTVRAFDFKDFAVLGFCIGCSLLIRFTDRSTMVVQMRSQMRALAITAHEFRTPLAGIQLLSTALEERLNDVSDRGASKRELSEMRGLAGELRRACADANTLIDTHLANANPSKPFPRREIVDVGATVRDAIASFQRGVATTHDLVNLEVARNFAIMAESGAVKQVVVNLLSNALKAVVKRHSTAAPQQIRIRVDFINDKGRLTVADTGGGIARHDLPRIFEPFWTGDPLHGHGLGLTFVRAAVNAYAGTISIESAADTGTAIILTFSDAIVV